MDNIKIHDKESYNCLEDEEKLAYLYTLWGTEYLFAKIDKVRSDINDNKFFFGRVFDKYGEQLEHPYEDGKFNEEIYIYLGAEDKEFNSDDVIAIEYMLAKKKVDEKIIQGKFFKKAMSYGAYLESIGEKLSIEKVNSEIEEKYVYFFDYDNFKQIEGVYESLLDEIKSEKENIEKRINENQEKIESINDRLESFKKIGIYFDKIKRDKRDVKCYVDTYNNISHICQYAKQKFDMNYSKDSIERFYYALKTNQIIILSGPPGTGKTSLVEVFSKAVGANYKIISVQTNWSDNQDLLGFYNPIEKRYISTPFLDELVKASEDKDNLYIICLDEMNLARVEYYFSELLSALERNSREDRVLNLYSEFEYRDLMDKVFEIEKNHSDRETLTEKEKQILEQFNLLKRYQPVFPIPDNVRFVGTINADETTKQLSPKVIDRSFIIEMSGEENRTPDVYSHEKMPIDPQQELYIPYSGFAVKSRENQSEISQNWMWDLKNTIGLFENVGVSLNNRFYQRIKELFNANDFKESDKTSFIDYVISSKILPKVSFEYDDENSPVYKDLERIKYNLKSKNYYISLRLLDKMIANSKNTQIVTFWS